MHGMIKVQARYVQNPVNGKVSMVKQKGSLNLKKSRYNSFSSISRTWLIRNQMELLPGYENMHVGHE